MAKNTPKYRQKLGMDPHGGHEALVNADASQKLRVAYLRVSDKAQEDKYGLASQLADIETYAAYKGYEIAEVFVDVFTGTVDSRKNLDRMKALLETGAVEEVLIYDIGRLARDIVASEKLYLEFRRHAKVTSVTERFADNIEGDLLRHIKQAFFHYDRAKMIQRMSAGKVQAVTKDGRWQGGFGLLGYRSIGDGQVRIVEEEAETKVIPLFELLADGKTRPQIAQELNARGITTMTGKKWDSSSVSNVISNQGFYSGEESIWAGVEVEQVAHEPILPAGLVERLQTALGRPPGTITVSEAAKMVGVTVQTIHRWQKAGLLEFITVAGKTSGRGRRAVFFLDPDQVSKMVPDRKKKCADRPKPEPSKKLRRETPRQEDQPKGTLTVQQAAERLHTSASTVRRMMEQGELDIVGQLTMSTAKAWLVSEAQVDAMPVRTHAGRQAGYASGDDHPSQIKFPHNDRPRKGMGRGGVPRAEAPAGIA